MSIKLFDPRFGEEELEAVKRVLASGILTSGPEVATLEREFADYVGGRYAIAVNSCTSALLLALWHSRTRVGYSGPISIPSVTFVSVANMIRNADLELVFNDDISVGKAYYLQGTPIIDSAHELHRGCYTPNSISCYSFYPTKCLGGAEGGMIVVDDPLSSAWLRLARSNGMERKGMFDWDYDVQFPGWKMNMSDIQAAIIRTRLRHLDALNERRRTILDLYNTELGLHNASLHVYPILVADRERFFEQARHHGIQTSVHFKPIHRQPAYSHPTTALGRAASLPGSDYWGDHEVSVPLHEHLTFGEVEQVSRVVRPFMIAGSAALSKGA